MKNRVALDAVGSAQLLAELNRAKEELRTINSIAQVGTWKLRLSDQRVVLSGKTCHILGFARNDSGSPQETVDLDTFLSAVHPDDRKRVHDVLTLACEGKAALSVDHRILGLDGNVCDAHLEGRLQLDETGRPFLSGTIQDITESRVNHDKLLQSETLLEIATRLTRMGGWKLDLPERRLTLTDEVLAVLELPPGTTLSIDEGFNFYPPESRATIKKALEACIRNGIPYDLDLQIITAKGRHIWIRTVGQAVRDASGTIIRVQGALQDITERKRLEEVRLLADRLNTALETTSEAFFILDHEWRFIYLNGPAERLMQRPREELVGKVVWDALEGIAGTAFERESRRAVRENRPVSFEEHYFPRDAWVEIQASPVEEGLVVQFRDITQRKAAELEIERLAFFDPLTRLPNRRCLLDRLEHALASSRRNGHTGALLFIDLDNFKSLNDTLGHDKGDILLQQVAQRLEVCVPRKSDTVARFGGDEFVVMLEDLREDPREAANQAETVAERVLAVFTPHFQIGTHEHHTTSSIGVALFDHHVANIDELLKRADLAMYQAKAAGRNTIRFFDPEMQTIVSARVALESDLRRGLLQHEFFLHYQRQTDAGGNTIGAEALVRWQHPRRGLMSPALFIPLAEETGLILRLGQWVLETACRQLATWAKNLETAHLTIAVNVSPRQFRHPEFVQQVLSVVERTGANPRNLKLELTETLLVENVDSTITKMAVLKEKGVSFALDDFGTGYSSLAYLKRLPLDQLKIDQSFVRDVLTDSNDAAIARTIVVLGQTLGLEVIAEGVETVGQRDFLAQHGCHAYQGYLFSRPLPAEQF